MDAGSHAEREEEEVRGGYGHRRNQAAGRGRAGGRRIWPSSGRQREVCPRRRGPHAPSWRCLGHER
eukprot:59075-Rhodomonas_salina.1